APWPVRPACLVIDREDIHVTVQGEVSAGLRRFEARRDVGLLRMAEKLLVIDPLARQELADKSAGLPRIATRVWCRDLYKIAEKAIQLVSIVVDRAQQSAAQVAHHSPSSRSGMGSGYCGRWSVRGDHWPEATRPSTYSVISLSGANQTS